MRHMSQFKYVLKLIGVLFTLSKTLFALTAMQIALKSAQPMVTVILSARIIQQLINQTEPLQIIYTALSLVLFNLIAGIVGAFLSSRVSILNDTVKDDFCLLVGQKIMKLPYERMEEPALLDLKQKALVPIIHWGNFEFLLNEAIPNIIGSIFTITATAVIVSRNNLLLLIPIIIVAVLCLLINGKRGRVSNSIMTRVSLIERKINYFQQLAVDFSSGKEIRLFGMNKIIMQKIRNFSGKELYEFSNLLHATTNLSLIEILLTQLQLFIIYGIVAYDVINRGLPIGVFLEVTGLFANVGTAVFVLVSALAVTSFRGRFFAQYFEFNALNEDEIKSDELPIQAAQDIKISNVSFSYAHTKKQVLNNISFTIPAGKKIALVGENGSGKTTLVKLICGLLSPTEGEILIGNNIVSGCAGQSVSAVFQDYKLFAFPIRENIEMSVPGKTDINIVLDRVGLLDDVQKLKKGTETPLYKSYDNEGVELSGGQGQKLAIARAMYKDTGLILLDEPTAALDPKAEAEIFNNFQSITTGKTAVLVSHRLSSCCFCDHIVVLENGSLIEQGTHEELMLAENGKYREMFTAQAEYYGKNTQLL